MTKAEPRAFWVFGLGFNSGAVINRLPEGSPDEDEFFEGRPLAGRFPAGGAMRFSGGFRKFIKVLDSVANTTASPIVSGKIRGILEKVAKKDCEFLPVTLIDHKGKVASKEHFVLNVLRIEDAVDMKRSKYKRSPFDPEQIDDLTRLHLQPDAIAPDAHIFRARTKRDRVFVDQTLVDAFEKAKVTGLRLFPAEGWDGDDM